jgi:fructose-specific phosphotransferase system IIC component
VKKFNNKIAVFITKLVGNMVTAYIFAIIACVALPAAIASKSPIIIVAWLSQAFLQLVLLPIIIVGQRVQGAASETRMEKTLSHISADNDRIIDEVTELLKGKK